MIKRFLGLTLIILGTILILADITIHFLPQIKVEWKNNPLIIFSIKKNGFLIGFYPLIFLALLILYLVLYLRYF